MKNITLSAEEELIERSRLRARQEKTTLNAVFRRWLARYALGEDAAASYRDLMKDLSYSSAGRRFTREELNER
ncbi:MAG: hypothetical protein R6V85_14160 [Polyangia bacterium]